MAINISDTTTSFLEKILESVHPLMAEGITLAAVPYWYNRDLFAMMRNREDGRDQGIIDRLTRYSFVVPLDGAPDGEMAYMVRPEERLFLQRYWILKDSDAYQSAHRRALTYWQEHPDPNPFAQDQSQLYHQLFVDIRRGMDFLVDRFRAYHGERHLAAVERLLDTAVEARFYLELLENDALDQLDDLLTHLRARLTQLRGNWSSSLETLRGLRHKENLAPWLKPYVARAYGYTLAHSGDYVAAIEQYRFALALFTQEASTLGGRPNIQAERARTMIVMGEAHVGLATSVRGHKQKVAPKPTGLRQLRNFFQFFLSLPLVVYLGLFLGRRVWHPRFWPTLFGLDWIVARLFATGAKLYTRADPILEQHGSPAEAVTADEQLAYLYLAMGDAEQARLLFEGLLAETSVRLGEYRLARLRVGLGEALTALGEHQESRQQLEMALPVLSLYQDAALSAEAEMFLGEAMLETGRSDTAVTHLAQALRRFQRQGNEIMVTEVAERLQQLSDDARLEGAEQQLAEEKAREVTHRHYPVRYRHPATIFFHRAAIGLLAVTLFLIFASVVRLDSGIDLVPDAAFNASPLLRSDTPDFRPDLSQGVVALNIDTRADSGLIVWLGVLLFSLYLGLGAALGFLAIARMPITRLQAKARSELICFDGHNIRLGEDESAPSVSLTGVTKSFQSDLFFGDTLMMDDSGLTLTTSSQRILIKGSTAWYVPLRERILAALPEGTERVDFSYSLLRGKWGTWYLATLAILTIFAIVGQFEVPLMARDIPGLRYSLADLYPYFYLGLFLTPTWSLVVQPLRVRLSTDPSSRLHWWVWVAGVALAVARWLTLFRPWLTIPDLYGPLLILLLVGAAGFAIVRAKQVPGTGSLYPLQVRVAVALVTAAVGLMVAQNFWRELGAYHYRVMGDAWRDRAVAEEKEQARTVQFKRAVEAYSRSIDLSQVSILGVDGLSALDTPFGIPPTERFTWVVALGNRAALLSQLGQFREAIDDYTALIDRTKVGPEVYADRAMAYQGLGTAPGDELGTLEVSRQNFAVALSDFDQAIRLAPGNARFLLWRGIAHHALGNNDEAQADYEEALRIEGKSGLGALQQAKAYTGLGWIAYSGGNYVQAARLFEDAVEANEASAEAYLGLGYAYYSLRQYRDALGAWEEGARLDPTNPIVFISLGTLYWRIGTLGEDYGVTGSDRCSSDTLSSAEKSRSATQLEKSLEALGRSTELAGQEPEDVAFTFRTMAQVQYLLRNCPGYDIVEALKSAIGYYQEALSLDPDNAGYWHIKARLSYAVWLQSPAGTGPSARQWLFAGLEDNDRALALAPVDRGDYRPNAWRDTILKEAVGGTMSQGDRRFANGEYALALAYYALVADNQADNATAAFRAGLAALAGGEPDQAVTWYEQGLDRALASGDESSIENAVVELQGYRGNRRQLALDAIEALFSERGFDLDLP